MKKVIIKSQKVIKRRTYKTYYILTTLIFILSTTLIATNKLFKPAITEELNNNSQTDQSTNSTPTNEKVNGIYGNTDFVVDYELVDNIYIYNNPDNLDPNQWYTLHQYYPTNYGYGGEEFSVPRNIVTINGYTFQYGEVFSYPRNYFATLISLNGKMFLKNFDSIPSTADLENFLRQINTINR